MPEAQHWFNRLIEVEFFRPIGSRPTHQKSLRCLAYRRLSRSAANKAPISFVCPMRRCTRNPQTTSVPEENLEAMALAVVEDKPVALKAGRLGSLQNGVAKTSEKPANIVLAEYATEVSCVHEWGHSCGLEHRGETINGVVPNPGPTNAAIMYGLGVSGRSKVNRFKRGVMNSY
jgi:hypothetical protein